MLDFEKTTVDLRFMGMEIPDHTRGTITNYLFRGWAPGGFVESMIAKDYERALYCADTANRQMFWAIAMWINECAPKQAIGSYDALEHWRDDLGGRRTAWATAREKEFMWKTLQGANYA